MHMMLLAFILVLVYFSSLTALYFLKDRLNKDVVNTSFALLIFTAFCALNIYRFSDGSLKDFMTLDNISPLTFTLVSLMFLMRKEVKESFLTTVAFLSVGMFAAMLTTISYAYLFEFRNYSTPAYVYDAMLHLLCSLFGMYLIISGQVKANFKNLGKAAVFLYSIITFGVILNVVFHKSYFGMDPYGKAKIYMFDLFSDFYSTLIAYYAGVAVVLLIGFQLGYFVEKLSAKSENESKIQS